MSHQYRLWQQQLTKSIEAHMPRDQRYVLLRVANMVGLFTCMFVKEAEKRNIQNVSASTVKRGLGGLHGNKVWLAFAPCRTHPSCSPSKSGRSHCSFFFG